MADYISVRGSAPVGRGQEALVLHAPLKLHDDGLASQLLQEWLGVDRDLRHRGDANAGIR